MKEYRVLHGASRLPQLEEKINQLAKEGFEVEKFESHGYYESYVSVLMSRDASK